MECSTIPARLIATCFALVAFAAATAVGLAADNPAGTILKRALIAMLICWFIGRLVGQVAQRAVQDHIDAYKVENPIPHDQENQPAVPASGSPTQKEPNP